MSPERKADGLAEGMAESFFKLIGARKSPHNLQQLKDSLKYISRDYDLKLEDERGNLYGKAEVQKILEHWQGIRDIPTKEGEKSSYAVSRHAIISVPAGSDVDALRDSVRELAAEVFTSKGFELFWTVHEHNDDHPNEPDHPHAHLIINAMSRAGKPCKSSRLNLRKADLQHIRERFAFIAREHGIELNATSRTVRGQHGAEHLKEKMFKQNDRPDMQNSQTTEREQEKTRPNDHSKSTKRRQRAYLARDEVIANCREWGETLLKSTDPADKKRGAQLLAHADRMERQREAELKLDRDLQKVSEQEKGKEQNERTTKATSSRSALKYPQQDQNTKHNDNARTREAIRKRKAHERDIREGRATYTEGELKKQRYAQYIREKRERARRQQDQELQR
ncbi:MAG: hypothetical protein IJ228_05555 [Succinivibrio sp.]|nr:hypothetical protein [Succinivibrio sp.]